MNGLESVHNEFGATFTTVGPQRVVADYGKPARTHRAVRKGVGVIEHAFDVIAVSGDDRVSFVDNAVTNHVPRDDGTGVYALLCDPRGAVETDCYVFVSDDQLLVLTPPQRTEWLVEEWRSKVFIDDVTITHRSELAVFGVYGGTATEKVASVLTGPGAPAEPLSFVRGSMDDVGVTVVADDYCIGDEGYFVVADASRSERLFDILLNIGLNAVPFGRTVWNGLTLAAGTPLFESELQGRIPNVTGVRNAIDFEKGCFPGQEVIARVENRGEPSQTLSGVHLPATVAAGTELTHEGSTVGTITRTTADPESDGAIGMALVDGDSPPNAVSAAGVDATLSALPVIELPHRSARCPRYE